MFRNISAILSVALLAACTGGGSNGLGGTSLQRAGGPPGSGGVCAYYSGATGSGDTGVIDVFRRRACFATAAQCNAWLYQVQSRYRVSYLRKPCGS